MRFSALRVVLFSLAGGLAGWLAGRGLRASSDALEQTGKPSPAILANTPSPAAATNKTRRIVFPAGFPASLNTLAAELDSTWFPSEQWKAARLQQLERCSNGQLAALARGLLERKGASPASRAMASLTLLLLAERDPGMAMDIACTWTASLSGRAESLSTSTMRTLVENVCERNGGDDAQLRLWLGRKNNVLSGALMAWLARSDPERALSLWTELQPVNGKVAGSWNAMSLFVSALASAGRIELALTLAESGKSPVLTRTAVTLACRSVTASQIPDLQARLAAGKYSEDTWSAFAGRFGQLDPQAALAWAQTLTDSKTAFAAMEGIAKSVTRDHPELVKSWLSSLPDGPVRNGLLSGALWELQTSDAKVILSAEKSLPAGLGGLGMVASDIHRADPVAAAEWAASLPDGPGKEHVLKLFGQDRTADDPRALLDDLARQPDSDERQTLIRRASASFAEARSIEWLAWCQTLPPEDRSDLLNADWGRLAVNAPATAARFAADHPDFLTKLAPAVKEWTALDIDAAAAFAKGLPDGPARETAIGAVTESWQKLNEVDCKAWRESVTP